MDLSCKINFRPKFLPWSFSFFLYLVNKWNSMTKVDVFHDLYNSIIGNSILLVIIFVSGTFFFAGPSDYWTGKVLPICSWLLHVIMLCETKFEKHISINSINSIILFPNMQKISSNNDILRYEENFDPILDECIRTWKSIWRIIIKLNFKIIGIKMIFVLPIMSLKRNETLLTIVIYSTWYVSNDRYMGPSRNLVKWNYFHGAVSIYKKWICV